MRLFNLSLKNFKKSIGDYTIYFFTLILGVSLFYSFNAIDHQTAMMELNSSQLLLVDMIMWILKLISIFVAIVLGFLIIYANNFLLKRRKNEFAMYMLLGMSKWQISKILLMETMILGTLSLLIGVGVGVLFSQGMAVFIANFFEAKISSFNFVISFGAIIQTCLYFGISFVFVMIFNVLIIGQTNLISLFKAKEKREKNLSKNTLICVLALVLAIYLLAKNYQIVSTQDIYLDFSNITRIMVEGALGTYLVFFSISGLMLKVMKLFKGFYYKNLNSFILKEFSYTINHTVALMSIVCLMLFMTITVLSSATTIKKHDEELLKKNFPCDFQVISYNNDFQLSDLPVDKNVFAFMEPTVIYEDMNCTYSDVFKEGTKGYEMCILRWGWKDNPISIVSYSDYKTMCNLSGMEPLSLNDDQYILSCNIEIHKEFYDEVLKDDLVLTINGNTLQNANHVCDEWFYRMEPVNNNEGVFIVPDACVQGLKQSCICFTGNFNTDKWQEKEMIVENMRDITDMKYDYFTNNIVDMTYSSMGTSTVLIFIGLYLGTTFLIACAALLALKQLCDVADHQKRYELLKKLGASQKEINRALLKQNLLFFFAPLVLALIHSCFGIQFITNLYLISGKVVLLSAMLSSAMILAIIYGGYFIITYWMQKRILER